MVTGVFPTCTRSTRKNLKTAGAYSVAALTTTPHHGRFQLKNTSQGPASDLLIVHIFDLRPVAKLIAIDERAFGNSLTETGGVCNRAFKRAGKITADEELEVPRPQCFLLEIICRVSPSD